MACGVSPVAMLFLLANWRWKQKLEVENSHKLSISNKMSSLKIKPYFHAHDGLVARACWLVAGPPKPYVEICFGRRHTWDPTFWHHSGCMMRWALSMGGGPAKRAPQKSILKVEKVIVDTNTWYQEHRNGSTEKYVWVELRFWHLDSWESGEEVEEELWRGDRQGLRYFNAADTPLYPQRAKLRQQMDMPSPTPLVLPWIWRPFIWKSSSYLLWPPTLE